MSTIIIYNPRLSEHGSGISKIRMSRKIPLEKEASPSSILGRKMRRQCGCVVAHIFSSAGGQKSCTICDQQHRPRGSQNQTVATRDGEGEKERLLGYWESNQKREKCAARTFLAPPRCRPHLQPTTNSARPTRMGVQGALVHLVCKW